MNKSKLKLLFGFFLAVFLAACGNPMRAQEEVALQFTRLANEGKVDEMVQFIAGFEKTNPNEIKLAKGKLQLMVAASSEETRKKGGIQTVRVNPEKKSTMVDENTAKVSVEILFANGSKSGNDLTLIQENGKWKVKL